MSPEEHLQRLDQRRQYLDARIVAKQSVGWETVYDQSERDALTWILAWFVTQPAPIVDTEPGPPACEHPEEKRKDTTTMGGDPEYICFACGATVKGIA